MHRLLPRDKSANLVAICVYVYVCIYANNLCSWISNSLIFEKEIPVLICITVTHSESECVIINFLLHAYISFYPSCFVSDLVTWRLHWTRCFFQIFLRFLTYLQQCFSQILIGWETHAFFRRRFVMKVKTNALTILEFLMVGPHYIICIISWNLRKAFSIEKACNRMHAFLRKTIYLYMHREIRP